MTEVAAEALPAYLNPVTATVAVQERGYRRKSEHARIDAVPGWLCWLCNKALTQRRQTWEEAKRRATHLDQCSRLPEFRMAVLTILGSVYGKALDATLARVDKAFDAFFRRCRAGEKPG